MVAPQDLIHMKPAQWSEAEPQVAWLPVLIQSQMPDGPISELVLTTPTPEEFVPPAPDTKNLINRMNQESRKDQEIADLIEDKLQEPEPPEVSDLSAYKAAYTCCFCRGWLECWRKKFENKWESSSARDVSTIARDKLHTLAFMVVLNLLKSNAAGWIPESSITIV